MLQEAVASLRDAESGQNEIAYVIGVDADDLDTAMAPLARGIRGMWQIAERFPSLGARVNALSLEVPADVYCSLCDDVVCTTPHWDALIAEAWQARPDAVWWWSASNGATYAIVSEKWREAAGRIFTEYFPFWFDDGWLADLWLRATGEHCLQLDIALEDRGAKTHRLRNLVEWFDFFWSAKAQQEREAEAAVIAAKLGWPAVEGRTMQLRPDARETFARWDVSRRDPSPPTPEYTVARERMLALHNPKMTEVWR